jgi:hypothetical protein
MAITGRRHPRTEPALDSERALDVERTLMIDALRLGRMVRDPTHWPALWTQPAFGAEVERCRRHISTLTTQEALAAAYDADVYAATRRSPEHAERSPIRVAYALRWLELLDGATGPSWPAMVR